MAESHNKTSKYEKGAITCQHIDYTVMCCWGVDGGDGYVPGQICRHGHGLSCGHYTRSYRCNVGNTVGSSIVDDVVWLYVARPMSLRSRAAR